MVQGLQHGRYHMLMQVLSSSFGVFAFGQAQRAALAMLCVPAKKQKRTK
jgi:hypothetical protein